MDLCSRASWGNTRVAVFSALLSVLAVGACGKQDGAADWTVSTDTVDGTIHVINTPPASGAGPTVHAEEEFRIGSVGDGGPASFGRIRTMAVLEDGRMAVADAQAEEVRLFDPEGRYLRTFGGRGQGPGELRGMQGVYLHPDGLLRVPEQENGRMSVFHPDTGFVRSFPFYMFSYRFRGPWEAAFDSAGRTLVASAGRFGEGRYWNMVRIYDTAMVQLDSIPYFDYTDANSQEHPGIWRISVGRGTLHVGVPFYAQPQEILSPAGEFWTSADGAQEFQVARWTPPGDTTLVLFSRRPPSPVTHAEADSAMAEVLERLEGRLPLDARLEPSRIPSFKPPVQGLSLDDRGRLWARLSGPGAKPTVYDVFNPDGTHAETVSLPFSVDGWIPPIVRGDTVWAVVTDEMDVQYVARARMWSVGDDG